MGTNMHTPRGNQSGPYLKGVRLGMGLTQREAARRIGVSTRTLQRYERYGMLSTMGCLHVFAVCNAYGVSADLLCDLAQKPQTERVEA